MKKKLFHMKVQRFLPSSVCVPRISLGKTINLLSTRPYLRICSFVFFPSLHTQLRLPKMNISFQKLFAQLVSWEDTLSSQFCAVLGHSSALGLLPHTDFNNWVDTLTISFWAIRPRILDLCVDTRDHFILSFD